MSTGIQGLPDVLHGSDSRQKVVLQSNLTPCQKQVFILVLCCTLKRTLSQRLLTHVGGVGSADCGSHVPPAEHRHHPAHDAQPADASTDAGHTGHQAADQHRYTSATHASLYG